MAELDDFDTGAAATEPSVKKEDGIKLMQLDDTIEAIRQAVQSFRSRSSPMAMAASAQSVRCPSPDAGVWHGTTPQSNGHDTTLVVLYPWHPWSSEHVAVHQVVDRRDRAAFRYRLLSYLAAKPREVPQWMFDHAACFVMQASDQPLVSVTSLQRLLHLLRRCARRSAVEANQTFLAWHNERLQAAS